MFTIVDDYCDFKVNVCAKTVNVSKKWFESKEGKDEFVAYVLTEVRGGYKGYNKY